MRLMSVGAVLFLAACAGAAEPTLLRDHYFAPYTADDYAQLNQAALRRAELIHICMKARGFDHQESVVLVDPNAVEVDSLSRRSEQGYGITVIALNAEKAAQQQFTASTSSPEDASRQAALWGAPSDDGTRPWDETGCIPQSDREIYLKIPVLRAQQLRDTLSTALADLEEIVRADGRMVALDQMWAGCMMQRGHGQYQSEESIREDIRSRLANAWREPAALDRLFATEVRLAVDAWECERDLKDRRDRVRAEYDVTFIDQHKATLQEVARLRYGN